MVEANRLVPYQATWAQAHYEEVAGSDTIVATMQPNSVAATMIAVAEELFVGWPRR